MMQLYRKKAKALLQLLLLVPLFTFAQCPPGNVTLTTQAEVDQFIVDYPNCTTINGYLRIGGSASDITNVNALSNLTHITGSLDILQNPLLTNITGLSNVTSIGYSLQIKQNAMLQSISSLSNINSVAQGLVIQSNSELQSLNGLQNITTLDGMLWITGNPQLQTLSGLDNLTEVGGDIDIRNNYVLNDITALQNIDPASITEVDGYGLTIQSNPQLSVCNLPNFCTYLANPANTHPRAISGNLANCVNEAAVVAACATPQCPPGNVTLQTQAQVNQFIVDYPNCTTINGYLRIGGSASDITNVNALSNLTHITGSLDITQNPLLTNITGLSNVTSIGGDLQIMQNATLQSISSLSNINSVAQGLMIQFNNQLQSLNGLQNITTLDGVLWIIENPQLQTLSGLDNLAEVGGDIDIRDNEMLNDITAVQNIDPASITEVDGYGLTIVNNPLLSVCNLPNFCTYLANPANTHPRAIWDNLANCVNEAAVVAACTVVQCPQGNVVLSTQAQVDQFIVDNPNCTVINGNLEISGAGITNLNALSNITSVTGSVIITSCPVLTDVTGINNITTIGGNLKISICNSLTTLGNTSNLTTVGGYVDIFLNPNLTSISALQNLTTIGGYLWIEDNNSLTTLDGLQNLAEVNGDVSIAWNAMLNDISALQNLNPASITVNQGFGLTILNNPMLAVCNLPNFCTYLSNPAETHPRNIAGNLANCINQAAVVAACEAMGTEDFGYTKIMAYPNPVVNVLTLSSSIELNNVSIINMLGQVVLDLKTNATQVDVDMSILPAGNYLVKVATQSSIQTIKLVKK